MTLEDRLTEIIADTVEATLTKVLAEQPPAPLVFTVAETAHVLAVSRRTVENWVAAGVLPRMPDTGRVLIPRKAVEAWVEANAT